MRSGIGSRQHQCEVPPRARGRVVVHTIHSRVLGNTPACAGKSARWARRCRQKREIPPRVQGRGVRKGERGLRIGNTPACAGKSHASATHSTDPQKYPRVRGEEASNSAGTFLPTEIPPRARGRAHDTKKHSLPAGNTPACAGKSLLCAHSLLALRKYLRVRGEEAHMPRDPKALQEIPPRARGRGTRGAPQFVQARNTPACAGKRW